MYEQPTIFTVLKRCTECEDWLPATAEFFHRKAVNKDGLQTRCKDCRCAEKRANQDRNREVATARRRLFRHSTPEEREALKREKREESQRRAKQRADTYYAENRERRIAYARQRYADHPDYWREWREKNRAKRRVQWRKYRAARRARIIAAGGSHSIEDIERIFAAQSGLCAYCFGGLDADYHVDHVVPLVRGGSNDSSNLCCACPDCNVRKGAKTPEEFMEVLRKEK